MTDKTISDAAILDLRQRLGAILADLNAAGLEDGEAMYVLGGATAGLIDRGGAKDWTSFKQGLPAADFARLLKQVETEGNQLVADGKHKAAYALQALAVSLVASRQDDKVLRDGEQLLDAVIDTTVANFRKHAKLAPSKAH
jgi:hypothetical protein